MDTTEAQGYDNRPELIDARGFAAMGGRGAVQPRTRAMQALHDYDYWITRAREHAENPSLGRGSEAYRAAAQMAYRFLGRYDILSEGGDQ